LIASPKIRELATCAGLAVVSLLSVLVAAEIALRTLGIAPERYPAMARLADRRWSTLLDCYPSNPRGYFTIDLRRPEARERFRWVSPGRFDAVATRAPYAVESNFNALRFRDRPLSPKPTDVARVLLIGDSFTEGQGVKEEDTYARLLESHLTAGGDRVEVRNCGRRGKDFPELFDTFQEAIPYGADVVIYAMVLNDGARTPALAARHSSLNDWILERGRMELTGDRRHLWWETSRLAAVFADRWEFHSIDRQTVRWYHDLYGPENAQGWKRTQQFIRAMDERTRAQGGRFLLALWPLLVDLGKGYPFAAAHEAVRSFCLSEGIRFFDLRAALTGPPATSLWVHPLDRHPNEIGHRLAAEALTPVVAALVEGETGARAARR
jgi:lysophospholipase L1-like esterase